MLVAGFLFATVLQAAPSAAAASVVLRPTLPSSKPGSPPTVLAWTPRAPLCAPRLKRLIATLPATAPSVTEGFHGVGDQAATMALPSPRTNPGSPRDPPAARQS